MQPSRAFVLGVDSQSIEWCISPHLAGQIRGSNSCDISSNLGKMDALSFNGSFTFF